ncbi:flap endonuclease 1-like isoform X1 [Impatiens glandulifera]|uniref:flap endonuclease 1-like isoform X1 n=1 Tax=Impatiens glandulifera TaxID=253017 RepID=UPI001FB14E8A|nr:flap endonuclease 1-like isoform X1 [Impatiens glandulifera]
MGVKGLTKLLTENAPTSIKLQKLESYSGRQIAIDANISIYQFLTVVNRNGNGLLTNDAGEVTSHLQGMLSRTITILEAGLKPIYVFDGKPPDLKKHELMKRNSRRADAVDGLNEALIHGNEDDIKKFSRQTVKVTEKHKEDCKKLVRLMGLPGIQAPSEAEAQCSMLCKSREVYAMASEDMDSLAFGAPRLLRHFTDAITKKVPVMEFVVSKALEELNLTMDQFIDLCILCGCDYCDTIYGVGGKTSLKLIRLHGSIEKILENINRERYKVPEDWGYEAVRKLFKEPEVYTDSSQLNIESTSPDKEGLMEFLVGQNSFSHDKVTKSIEKITAANKSNQDSGSKLLFKPAMNSSVPVKQKEVRCVIGSPKLTIKPSVPFLNVAKQLDVLHTTRMSNREALLQPMILNPICW